MKANGSDKSSDKRTYSTGDDALARNRLVYIMRNLGGLLPKDIAVALGITRSRVQQILTKHAEDNLWLADFSAGAHAPDDGMFTRIGP